jgi:tetratricopeptide (TPR) repeat protein
VSIKDRSTNSEIDLGDDLLSKTATIPGEECTEVEVPLQLNTPAEVEDNLQSAKILMNEGLIEEAKKIFRKIILVDSHNVIARQKLEEIHERELQQIFSDDYMVRSRRKMGSDLPSINTEELMRQLDQDLKLGVFDESGVTEEYINNLEQELAGSPARDRMDLGIAFTEMGLYGVAIRQFKAACRDPALTLASTGLLAYVQILDGKAFEAVLTIEAVLGDSELKPEEKIDFIYLMGRANECLCKPKTALQWYQKVQEIDPDYRDVEERVSVLRKAASGNR